MPRLLQQAERHSLALDHIQQGLCMFDGRQCLMVFNRLYAEVYDLDPSQLRIGTTRRDLADLHYATRTRPGMAPDDHAA